MALFGVDKLRPRDEKKVWKDGFSLKKAGCVIMIARLSKNLIEKEGDLEHARTIKELLDDLSRKILQCQNRLEIRQIILDEAENWDSPGRPVLDPKTGEINWKNASLAISKVRPEFRSYHVAIGTALHIVHKEFWVS